MTPVPSPGWSRRDVLKAAGLAGLGATVLPSLAACGVGGGVRHANGASEVTGSFDWKAAKGQTVRILQTPHPYQQSFQPLLKEFTEKTGIQVVADLVPEGAYFTKLNTELAGG
jgi:multiple sugar transport system substrate-binding protein